MTGSGKPLGNLKGWSGKALGQWAHQEEALFSTKCFTHRQLAVQRFLLCQGILDEQGCFETRLGSLVCGNATGSLGRQQPVQGPQQALA